MASTRPCFSLTTYWRRSAATNLGASRTRDTTSDGEGQTTLGVRKKMISLSSFHACPQAYQAVKACAADVDRLLGAAVVVGFWRRRSLGSGRRGRREGDRSCRSPATPGACR
jgi:hypothetical protein